MQQIYKKIGNNVCQEIRRTPPMVMSHLEASAFVGVSSRGFKNLVDRGVFKSTKLGGRIVYTLADLKQSLKEQTS